MGSVCCCLRVEDFEDYMNPNSSVYRNCMCLGCFLQNFLNVYTSLFRRGDMHSVPSSIQGAASMTSTSSLDNSLSDIYRSPPRPLPYDADPRYFRLQHDGFVSRREKGSSQFHEESEPLRGDYDADSDSLSGGDKWNDSSCEDGSKEQRSKSSLRLSSAKSTAGIGYIYPPSEDEDVCPTCLEEYTPENPKIVTKCSHHFHLGCIYEWMERSENCPVCGKVIPFALCLSLSSVVTLMIRLICVSHHEIGIHGPYSAQKFFGIVISFYSISNVLILCCCYSLTFSFCWIFVQNFL